MSKVALNDTLYRSLIGKKYAPFSVHVTADRIRDYSMAIGDHAPFRTDAQAARALGYRDCVAPPTFGFTLTLLADQADLVLSDLGFTMNDALHGEQQFEYMEPICAGDTMSGHQQIVEVREKKGGSLLFLITGFELRNQLGQHALTMTQTSIVPLVPSPSKGRGV